MKNFKICFVLSLLLATLAIAGNASAYTFNLSDAAGSPGGGVSVTLTVAMSDSDAPLYATQFDVNFDSAALTYTGFNTGSAVSFGYDNAPTDPPSPVTVALVGLGFPDGLQPSITYDLATFNFTVNGVAAGETYIRLSNVSVQLDPLSSDSAPSEASAFSTVTIQNSTAVPEPSSILLIGAGIACLFVARRRSAA